MTSHTIILLLSELIARHWPWSVLKAIKLVQNVLPWFFGKTWRFFGLALESSPLVMTLDGLSSTKKLLLFSVFGDENYMHEDHFVSVFNCPTMTASRMFTGSWVISTLLRVAALTIPPFVLMFCDDFLAQPLTNLFNIFLSAGIFPEANNHCPNTLISTRAL